MLNIPVQPGTYFLEVASVSSIIPFADRYDLTVGVFSQLSGDFNADSTYDCADIDSLVSEIAGGGNSSAFDLNGDGVTDELDLGQWLAEAGANNLSSGNAFLPGDADLDGFVDVSDFNIWNGNAFTVATGWCGGDFNADGFTDVGDFNVWNSHNFQSADFAAPVPEPNAALLLCLAGIFVAGVRRRAL